MIPNDAKRLRELAVDARAVADQLSTFAARSEALRIAENYEALANRAEGWIAKSARLGPVS